jgi:hypothetical protein
MTTFRIVLEGTTLAGFDPESVRPQLAALIKSTEEAAGRLLSGKSSTVKSGVDQATALRYTEALRAIGVDCRIESEASVVHVEDDDAPQRTRGQQIVDMFMVDAGDSKRHRVVVDYVFPGQRRSDVRSRLAKLLGQTYLVAGDLLDGHPRTVKSAIDEATATSLRRQLTSIGVVSHVEDDDTPPPTQSEQSIQLQWRWSVLILGSLLLILAAMQGASS